MRLRSKIAISLAVAMLVAAGPGVALASWAAGGTGSGSSKAVSMPSGNAPTVSVTGRNVTVSWTASNLPGPTPVNGYVVDRYDAGTNASQTVGASCSGTVAALTCTEAATPAGSWYYKVTPKQGSWLGVPSAASANVSVAAPNLTFSSSTTMSTLPTTLAGTIASFATGETITFRLDNPTSGTILTGSAVPGTIATGGGATISVTIPTGTSNGAHTVYAVGSLGTQAGAGITVAVDIAPPSITAQTIAKTTGYSAGSIKQGGTYYVYANVTDPSPSSGIATVKTNVNNITTGSTAVNLVAGAYTINGVSYNYRSASLTANAVLTAGAKTFSVTATDNVALSTTVSGSVTVDNTAPAASDVQSANGGATAGKIEVNDSMTYTFTKAIDPQSVLAGWTGASSAVSLRFTTAGGGDYVLVYNAANTTLLPLNRLNFGGTAYITTTGTNGTGSMTMSGSTITITVTSMGSAVSGTAPASTMNWVVNAGMYDQAGNACPSVTKTQTGGPKINF